MLHLAAIPAPLLDQPERVFGVNTLATYVVMEQAAQAGIARVVFASSQSILGISFGWRARSGRCTRRSTPSIRCNAPSRTR